MAEPDGEMLDYEPAEDQMADDAANGAAGAEAAAPEQAAAADGPAGGGGGGGDGGGAGAQADAAAAEPDAGAGNGHAEEPAAAPKHEHGGGENPQADEEEDQPVVDPDNPMTQPPHGTEVYITNLAPDATEKDVRSFAKAVGKVYQVRLPRSQEGRNNRGFGFVVYWTREGAQDAVDQLNGLEMPGYPGRKLRLNASHSKNKLYFGNLPRSYTQLQVETHFNKASKGVESVELVMDKANPTLNRGFCFVTYYNHACAEAARKHFSEPDHSSIGGRPVHVTWAEPKRDDTVSTVMKAVFVGGLPASVNEDKLIELFKQFGEIDKVMLPYSKDDPTKYREYGFVHFKERSSVLDAVGKHDKAPLTLDDKELTVQVAKPPAERSGDGPGPRGGPRGYGGSPGGGYGGPPPPPRRYGPPGGARGGYDDRRERGADRDRGYGRPRYDDYDDGYRGRGDDDYYEGGDRGYGGGGGGYSSGGYAAGGVAYAAPAAAAPTAGATVMVPVQLPSGQIGYMVVPATTAAAAVATAAGGAGGPVRRAGYGPASPTAGQAYGARGGGGGSYRPY